MMTILTMVPFLIMGGLSSSHASIAEPSRQLIEEQCPPCELLFGKLKMTKEHAKLTQDIRVQQRGEPKSGTSIMYVWASGAVLATCNYLNLVFGYESCKVDFMPEPERDGHTPARPVTIRMTFEPAEGASNAKCPCDTIERVSIVISAEEKHTLPVDKATCAFSHNRGIELAESGHKSACRFADGTHATSNEDLWRCMHEADCDITDDWLQMVTFRDPRPTAVSSYYHLKVYEGEKDIGDLATFVARELPILCEWLAVRHILFTGILAHQSTVFWYKDAMADPLGWFYRWFDSVGVHLPPYVVSGIADLAAADDLGRKIDVHPGEKTRIGTGMRRFEDEVSPEVLRTADAVLRVWLPPVLLEHIGVAPAKKDTSMV